MKSYGIVLSWFFCLLFLNAFFVFGVSEDIELLINPRVKIDFFENLTNQINSSQPFGRIEITGEGQDIFIVDLRSDLVMNTPFVVKRSYPIPSLNISFDYARIEEYVDSLNVSSVNESKLFNRLKTLIEFENENFLDDIKVLFDDSDELESLRRNVSNLNLDLQNESMTIVSLRKELVNVENSCAFEKDELVGERHLFWILSIGCLIVTILVLGVYVIKWDFLRGVGGIR